jgi:Uma2 family endonuclease
VKVAVRDLDLEPYVLDLPGLVFPVELELPEGFVPEDTSTWPHVEGRLEYVGGRLLYLPPTGELQSTVTADAVGVLAGWQRRHPDFVAGAGDAGMKLGEDVRGADVAIWRRKASAMDNSLPRTPPILAVEVSGGHETIAKLRPKAQWYLEHGVTAVWMVDSDAREALACTASGESRHRMGDRMPPVEGLPDLDIAVADLFRQVSRTTE